MNRVWLTWLLLVMVQLTPEAVGQFDLPSPYGGTMYGERVPFALACLALAVYLRSASYQGACSDPAPFWRWERWSSLALSACIAALLATPEPSRFAYPAVMAWAQVALALQLSAWAFDSHERLMLGVVAGMQWLGAALFIYAQARIGLTPVPQSALYYLHGPWADLAPALLGTALLAWASLKRE